MTKKLTSIRMCEIVTNLQKDGTKLIDLETLEDFLKSKKCIRDYAYIIHDKDIYSETEEKRNPEHKTGTLKTPHIHLLLRFEERQPQKLECVANWFKLETNFINKIQGKWDDACLYLIHKNAPDKYPYSSDEVKANFDYDEFLEKIEDKPNLDFIINKILDGSIREYNKTLEIDNKILVSYSRIINEAFKVRSEYLQATQKERQTECVFVSGKSGSGKTTLAKRIATENNLDYFVSSGSNDIMDGYGQEPCLILDDIRPSSLGLSDMLKMLDPHTASSVKSRYKNKYLNCDLIILTTVLDIDNFYSKVFADQDEPVTQLKRRCRTYIQVYPDTILISAWDDINMKYTRPVPYKNTILKGLIPEKPKTKEDVKQHVTNMMPFLEIQESEEMQKPKEQPDPTFTLTKADKSELSESERHLKNAEKVLAPLTEYNETIRKTWEDTNRNGSRPYFDLIDENQEQ